MRSFAIAAPLLGGILLGFGVLNSDWTLGAAQAPDPQPQPANRLNGKWTYRSFRSDPNLAADPAALLFGKGTLVFDIGADNQVRGTLGGDGWQLQLTGTYKPGDPAAIRFQGKGKIDGEDWVYDYLGYAVPAWPNGVDQRPAIIGSIVRTVPHSGGTAPAGYVAQWIAVRDDGKAPSPMGIAPAQKKDTPYRKLLREMYLKQDRRAALSAVPNVFRAAPQTQPAPGSLKPETIRSANGRLDATLEVRYTTVRIGLDEVNLRTYNGKLIGPVLRAKAGDTLYITLINKLPVDPVAPPVDNGHHEWNTTNLHFHGLHVAPQGPAPDQESDNVLLSLRPTTDAGGAVQKYAVTIPANHVAGTFWYHAHRHGSVAAQVSSGMAGALIIERDDAVHNLDSVPEVAAAAEEIMVLQEIPYLKNDPAAPGSIELSPETDPQPNQAVMFGPGQWPTLKRYITVNGERIPTITVAPGEVRRLRLVATGQRESMRLRIERAPNTVGTGADRLKLYEIAVDGLPTGGLREFNEKQVVELFPGYRSDLLLLPPTDVSGEYYLVDTSWDKGGKPSPATGADGSPELLRWVAKIVVTGAPKMMSLPTVASLSPHRLADLSPTAVTGTQYAFYGLYLTGSLQFMVSREDLSQKLDSVSPANAKSFNATYPRVLTLGKTERWRIGSRNDGANVTHPFHIHINPFLITQVWSLVEPGHLGTPVDVTSREIGSPTWRDTLAMKQGYTYELLTRYDDYPGSFVNHCHILDHEDNGMMELVRIDSGGPVALAPRAPAILDSEAFLRKPPVAAPRVLLFIKGSFCPHCMDQLVQFAQALDAKKAQVTVVTASGMEDVKSFPEVPFEVVADPELKVFRKFGAEAGKPLHATIVLNDRGKPVLEKRGDVPFMDDRAVVAALAQAAPRIVIAVRKTDTTDDDFITWAPTTCQMRMENGDPKAAPIQVTLVNAARPAGTDGGEVRFAATVTPGQTATLDKVSLMLPQDGTPVDFIIAGSKPSRLTATSLANQGRDAVIEVHRGGADGPVIGSQAVMVRVRMNASSLNDLERQEFLNAIAAVKGSGMYERMLNMHTIATGRTPGATWPDQAHRSAGFLPWHRAYLLQFEREMQKTHPHVALHYWREDLPSTVFQPSFIGANQVLPPEEIQPVQVDFGSLADGNPLFGWEIQGVALQRWSTDRSDLSWCNAENITLTPDAFRSPNNNFSQNMEDNPHNQGHGWVGPWMASCQTSPQDPVFYLFHSDIERLWAKWQWKYGRFGTTGSDVKDYFPNDKYAKGTFIPLGHHLKDTMWPWDQITGPGDPKDKFDNRPPVAPEAPFPATTVPGLWPPATASPTVANMIDYLGVGGTVMDLGYCYDDAPFGRLTGAPAVALAPDVAGALALAGDRTRPAVERHAALAKVVGPLSVSQQKMLLDLLRDTTESDELRRASLRHLSQSRSPAWMGTAGQVLNEKPMPGAKVRRAAAHALGVAALLTREGHDELKTIVPALQAVVNDREPPEMRMTALASLTALHDAYALDLLKKGVAGSNNLVPRVQALRLLASSEPGKNLDLFRPLLTANEPAEVRIAALLALGADAASLKDRRAIALDKKEPAEVREAALRSLLHRDPQFIDLTTGMVKDAAQPTRMRAAALGALNVYLSYRGRTMDRDMLALTMGELRAIETTDPALQQRLDATARRIATTLKTRKS
jgi:FtsP/CotA-like multicopper oxidase with cupredoxin domain/peroxiredoxin